MIYLSMVFIIFLNSYSQILLKKGADLSHKNNKFLNRFIILGYTFFIVITILSVFLLKFIDIKQFTIVISCNYLVAYIMAIIFLKEQFTFKKLIGTAIIVIGVIVYNLK